MRNSTVFKKILFVFVAVFMGAYVFCLPAFGQSTTSTLYFVYISMFLFGATVFTYIFLYEDFKFPLLSLLIPAFVLFAFIGTAVHSHQYRSWLSLVLLAGSFYIFLFGFKCIKNRFIFFNIIIFSLLLFSFYFFYYYRNEIINFKVFKEEGFRLGSHFDNPNGIAIYSLVGISFSLIIFSYGRNKIKYLYIIPFLFFLLMGIVTGSRTFVLGLLLFIFILLFSKFKRHKLVLLFSIVLIFTLFIVALNMPFMSTIKSRFIRSLNTLFGIGVKVDTSTIERYLWTDYGIYMGSKNVLIGYGCKGFPVFSGTGTYAHNNYAEVICDFGIIGSILFYFPLGICLFKFFSSKNRNSIIIVSFVSYYILASFFNVFYYNKVYYMVISILFYLTFIDGENEPFYKQRIKDLKRITVVYDSSLVTLDSVTNVYDSFSDFGVSISFFNSSSRTFEEKKRRFGKIADSLALRKKIKIEKPDLVISFPDNNWIVCHFALLGFETPYIIYYSNIFRHGLKLLNRMRAYFADGVIFDKMSYDFAYQKRIKNKSTYINMIENLSVERKKEIASNFIDYVHTLKKDNTSI